ncbi:3-deoxy-manno-octulosonate cytidylyltransferase [Dysgonomonas termitidis]|uniref:3-deoxy-manno-octulosonate cytidylyltransferase n=1 Tax=Dysgonomonas termitidis TaxID=1516126 RepID=A0ABV9L0C0_9BACT
MKKIIGVIPARYKSSRFPGKPLALINGKPMIIYVAELTAKALGIENTYVATDDQRIFDSVTSFGFNVVMTSESCLTGTDRLWDFAQQIEADIYVNIQGDEPLLNPDDIKSIVNEKLKYPDYVINGMCSVLDDEDPKNINIPKVLTDKDKNLIYMSRLAIPGIKSESLSIKPIYKKQVCIYAFSYEELKAFGSETEKAYYEQFEDIEILRFFDLNIPIKMVETTGSTIAVDNPEDILAVERILGMN